MSLKTLVILSACLGIACGQFNLGGLFGRPRGPPRRPPPGQNPQFAPRPQQNGPPPQQQQFQPRPQPQFNARPQPRPRPQPAQRFPEQPRRPAVQPQQQAVVTQPPTVVLLEGDFASPGAASPSSSAFNCPINAPNYNYQGRGYIVTFFDTSDGCNKFTGQEADDFCKSKGGRAVSLDSNEKALAMMDLLRQRAQRYMWTGGRIDHNVGVVTWPSGAREGYNRGQRFWSHTGGKKKDPNCTEQICEGEPQPDNRDGNEICIGVLNNFYADGIKWHDVSCHHRKPTICEL